ncbi:glycosyltransferase family 4 protein [Candidatus Parcubacteria bacterium]|nr:glycosyltransferase family 4 protein [Candidatus Parcubacteria bacterium]
MRILFDATTLCAPDGSMGAGIEQYTRCLLQALIKEAPRDVFFVAVPPACPKQAVERLIHGASNIRLVRTLLPRVPFLSRHLIAPIRAALCVPDVYFSPFGQLPLGWPGKRSAVTVHDLSIFDHPEWFPETSSWSFTTRYVVPRSFARATNIICVSHFTLSRLQALFPETTAKTVVVHEGVELGHYKEVEFADRFPFERDYLLCLGTVEPRKNLVAAFRAFDRFLQGHPDEAAKVRLIVAGKSGWKTAETEEAARAINHAWKKEEPEGVIRFMGGVTEEEKWYLLSRAAGLVLLSHEEGFGLPVLEAMSVGTPVIVSRGGALEEVAGDSAIMVDPDDTEAVSLALAQCLLVPEGLQSLREDGYRRAKQFSWEETAKKTIDVLHNL